MTTSAVVVPDLDWRPRALAFAEHLAESGIISHPALRHVFATVPRHLFVPRFWELNEYNSPTTLVSGEEDDHRGRWLDAVYSDRFLITQWAPGCGPEGIATRIVTSSASQPSIVATMLDRLGALPGHRVLEVGTGTGYNASLLSALLGAEQVTSIEIDAALVDDARDRLDAAGFHPTLHIADGAVPLPGGWVFDRIVATCSVRRIPSAWVTQLAPGGRLVVPLGFGGALAVLDKTNDQEASGRIDMTAVYFMPLREAATQPMPDDFAPPLPATQPAAAHHGLTDVDPAELDRPDFQLWLALHHPGLQLTHHYRDDVPDAAIVYGPRERAVVETAQSSAGLWTTRQQNGRPWDTVESAWRAFLRTGRPRRDRLGLTARTDGSQHLWLDQPESDHIWPVPDRP